MKPISKELEQALASRIKEVHDLQINEAEEFAYNFEDASKARKPIVSAHVMKQLLCGVAATEHLETWKEWGFTSTNSVLIFQGPPGTGKTTAGRWLARKLNKRILVISYADIGSEKPGESERNIREIFAAAKKRKAVIFLDDAESLVRSRAMLSKDEQWLLSAIAAMLLEIEQYNGNIILATNMPEIIDPAMARRVAYRVQFTIPDEPTRLKLWRALWPESWPLDYSGMEINKFVKRYVQTGAQIEMSIENAARAALVEERHPTWQDIDTACQQSLTA